MKWLPQQIKVESEMKMLNEWKLNSNDRFPADFHIVTTALLLSKHLKCKNFKERTIFKTKNVNEDSSQKQKT